MIRRLWLIALTVCLVLTACKSADQPPVQPGSSTVKVPTSQKEDSPSTPDTGMTLGTLAVELVVDWEEADRVLSSLDQLSSLLSEALLDRGCAVDEVRVTLSTAGGFTVSALAEGGVDVAWLPAEDFAACADYTSAVLTAGADPCTGVAAVSTAREELDSDFQALLAQALLDTEPGRQFTALCYPGQAYAAATESAVQALLDWAAQQETAHGE